MAKTYGGRWEVIKTIGGGGQAQVYEVRDLNDATAPTRALKRLQSNPRPQAMARFRAEVGALNALEHENVLQIITFDVESSEPYYVAEYCAGGNLSAWRRINPEPSVLDVIDIVSGVCAGLQAGQTAGVTHRDIKPDNILFRGGSGAPVVADWGICHIIDGEKLTLSDEKVGSPYYICPILARGRAADSQMPLCDVYSLGKLLYWMLTGKVLVGEDHREPENDLWILKKDPTLEHISRLLDYMLTKDFASRIRDATQVLLSLRDVRFLIANRYNSPSFTAPQRCTYCGIGQYSFVAGPSDPNGVNKLYGVIGNHPGWVILECRACGNIQQFRCANLADGPGKWR